ncbi:MAG: T9SS type A sorting domain-containing protein [Candidatus Kapabacteria bacterium]|nr:T9SS type A sorting domain-containing protein [Ignavibacteriota bacterium]MCW5885309.1 T9SS type A sorting domain-containing protein [Candidatus Kapabacteria bacterium]
MQRLLSILTAGLLLVMLSSAELFAQPSTQSSNISFSNIAATSVRVIVGTRGNGDGRIIVIEEGNSISDNPTDVDDFYSPANANFGSAEIISSDTRVVFSATGTGRIVTITGLQPGTEYTVKAFEFDGDGYNLSDVTNNPRSFTTLPERPASVFADNVTFTSFRMNWTNPPSGDWDGFELTASLSSTFATGLVWYTNLDIGDINDFDIEDAPPTDITPNTTYYYRVRSTLNGGKSAWRNGAPVTTLPQDATLPYTSAEVCLTNTHILTPTGPNPGNGTDQHKFRAYDAEIGGTAYFGGFAYLSLNLTPTAAGETSFWIAAVSNKTGLESGNRVEFIVDAYQNGPIANAGPDQDLCDYTEYFVDMEGNDPSPATGTWTIISKPSGSSLTDVDLEELAYNDEIELDAYGTYVFRWTITQNGCNPTFDDVTITLTEPPSEAEILTGWFDEEFQEGPPFGFAGVCNSLTIDLEAVAPTSGTGTWVAVPYFESEIDGDVTFSPNANSPEVTVTVPGYGLYYFIWSVSSGGACDDIYYDEEYDIEYNDANYAAIMVIFEEAPTVADAGEDIEVCGNVSVFLNANTPEIGYGEWEQISGPGSYDAIFEDYEDPNTEVTIPEGGEGTYVFVWTIYPEYDEWFFEGTICPETYDEVTVTWSPEISDAVAAYEEYDCGDLVVFLNATPPTVGTGMWTVTSAPEDAEYYFDNATYPDATFETDSYGDYTLLWTVSDPNGICESNSDDISFGLGEAPTPADAGFDQNVCGLTTNLFGSVPILGETGMWYSSIDNIGDADFADASMYNTSVTVTDYGTYSFEWTIETDCATSSDYVYVTFWNELDEWTAGVGGETCINTEFDIEGSDPSGYAGTAYGEWITENPQDPVDIEDRDSYSTTVTFSQSGTYVLRWQGYNGPCTVYDEITIVVNDPPTVTFDDPEDEFCSEDDSDFDMTSLVTPEGGTFSGPGVSGNFFNPYDAGYGEHTITYTYESGGCVVEETATFVVVEPEYIYWEPEYYEVCIDWDTFELDYDLEPYGGTFSGPGVTGYDFDPALAGPGYHEVTYTAPGACAGTETITIAVYSLPEVTCPEDFEVCINDDWIELDVASPSGGWYSGDGISGDNFIPGDAGLGEHTITYYYYDDNTNCQNSCEFTITVNAAPDASFSDDYDEVCDNGGSIDLSTYVTNPGGTFSGTGVSGNYFDPEGLDGDYEITYSITNEDGCSDEDYMTIYVNVAPVITSFENVGPVCVGSQPFTFTAEPEGGSYSGSYVSGNEFDPSTVGEWDVTYTVTDENGCTSEMTITVEVIAAPEAEFTEAFEEICEGSTTLVNLLDYVNPPDGAEVSFSGTGVSGDNFDPTDLEPGDYTITYEVTVGECSDLTTQDITINALPEISCPFDLVSCIDHPLQELSEITGASPSGGVYSGTGVSDGFFNPSIAGAGEHTITYTITDSETGCSNSCEFTFLVNPLPEVVCPEDFEVCINANPVTLSGASPTGGNYSGEGVESGIFDPSVAGAGDHVITYTYIALTGCVNTCTFTITVNPLPELDCPEDFEVCIDADAINLTELGALPDGGYFSGDGVLSDVFTPSVAGADDHTITYTYTDPETGCVNTCTFTITVNPLPEVDCPEDFEVCVDAEAIDLTELGASPEGGSFSGEGVESDIFDPSVAGVDVHTITYTYTDSETGCVNTCTFEITVNALPVVEWDDEYSSVCADGDEFALTGGYPTGGVYSGAGVYEEEGAYYFDPSEAGAGSHTLTYTYTDENDCVNSITNSVQVDAIVLADAGDDDNIAGYTYELSANTPSAGMGTWTLVDGPEEATADFADENDPTTEVTVSEYGVYTFGWEIINGACYAYDEVEVTFTSLESEPTALRIDLPAGPFITGQSFNITVVVVDGNGDPVNPNADVDFTLDVYTGISALSGQLTGTIPTTGTSLVRTITLDADDETLGEAGIVLVAMDDDAILNDGYSNAFNLLPIVPPNQATNMNFTNVTTSSLTASWTTGVDAVGSVVVAARRNNIIPLSVQLSAGTAYNAGTSTWNDGTNLASNTFVAYVGTGETVDITDLASNRNYAFKVYAYNGSGSVINYNNTNADLESNNRVTSTLKGAFDIEDLPLVGDNILSSSYLTPNPARDNVSLTIDLSQSANVTVSFFTADGKQVLLPVSGTDFNAGRHSFNIPLKGLAAGVYSVVISAGNEVIIENVVVMP